MKKSVIMIVLWGIVQALFSQENEGRFAPLNPDFIQYQKSKTESSFIPPTYNISFDSLPKLRSTIVLPAKYDMRDLGILTPPSNQGVVNACWTFATMDAIQSVWARMGFSTTQYSQENIANCHGFDVLKNGGGNSRMAVAYLSRFNGPVLNASDPFVNNALGTCKTSITNADKEALVSQAIYLPNDVHSIKQMVYRFGGVSTAMYSIQLSNTAYYNPATFSVFMKTPLAPLEVNHAGTIVGWDDDKIISNPIGDNPTNPGAWIVKGTYGTAKFEGGYFYVSYEDCHVGSYAVVFPQRIEKSRVDTVFYYDKLGPITNYGNGVTDSATVLQKYTSPQKKLVTAIGTYTSVAASIVDIQVYQTKTGEVLSGLLGERKGLYCEYPGFHSFDFPVAIEGDFYVKIKYKTPGLKMPIPIEKSELGFATVNVMPVGYQWFKLVQSDSLRSVGTSTRQFNLCVKVFAQNMPNQALFSTPKNRYCVNDTVVFRNKSVGTYDSFNWNFGEGATPQTATTTSVNDTFKVVYATGGMKKVVLKTTSGAVNDSIVKGNAVEIVTGVPLDIQAASLCGGVMLNKTVYLKPTGGDSYHWNATPYFADTTANILSFVFNESPQKFIITATLGKCVGTDSITVTPENGSALYDDIADAKQLIVGVKEGPFSNACATWQQIEPHPTTEASCTSQVDWCSGQAKLDNSIWFKFTAPSNDSVKIVTSNINAGLNFDNQIALYDAIATGTFADIMSGNAANYTILAANDDSSDTRYTATIAPIKITPGKTYWLQMDGSAGGVSGSAYITVTGINAVDVNEAKTDSPSIVNPVQNGHLIINNAQTVTQVELIDLSGKVLLQSENNGNLSIELAVGSIKPSYYLVKMQTDKTILTQKVLVK